MLFPVFAGAREKARQISCLSNEKQLALAFTQYTQDNDETFPCGRQPGGSGHYGYGWAGEIYPYVKSAGVYRCPDDSTLNSGNAFPISYIANLNLIETYYATPSPATLARMSAPASTVLLAEFQGQTANVTDPAEQTSPLGTGVGTITISGNYATGYLGGRDASAGNAGYASWQFPRKTGVHNDGSNFLMADCHAKWLKGEKVSSGAWSAANPTDDQKAPCTQGNWSASTCAAAGTQSSNYTATFSIN
jgi:prepilin-type processing-associated H-X9-DG protein